MDLDSLENLKIYHIVHVENLPSIVRDNLLWSDSTMQHGTSEHKQISMGHIKQRRLEKALMSYPDLHVGECVPFYFCPRSIMLYIIHKGNSDDLNYKEGQEPIVHLEADFHRTIEWAKQNHKRWAFTLTNAGSSYFEDRSKVEQLEEIDWDAVFANDWRDTSVKEKKQAEFLMESCFP